MSGPRTIKCLRRECRWIACLFAGCVLQYFGAALALAQSGISTKGDLTLLQTGSGSPLVTLMVPFTAVPANSPVLSLDFGFATAEPDAADALFDAFSLTVGNTEGTLSAVLFTADRTGVEWAPATSGGVLVTNLSHAPTNFLASAPTGLITRFAFAVNFALPAALAAGPVKLFFDLVDNLNQAASLAYFTAVQLKGESAPPVPIGFKLVSSDNPAGPYLEEASARLDVTNRTFTASMSGAQRFYRVLADGSTLIANIRRGDGGTIFIQFGQTPGVFQLMAASEVDGTFSAVPDALLDPAYRTFTIHNTGRKQFFRLNGNKSSRISTVSVLGEFVVLAYTE